jgi:hypothetical protein
MSHSRTLLRKFKTAKKGRAHRSLPAKGERNRRLIDVSDYAPAWFDRNGVSFATYRELGLEATFHVTKGLRVNKEGAQ